MSERTYTATLSRFVAPDGLPLYFEWWMPQVPKAILVVVHGIGEHSGRYGPFVRHFAPRGFGVALYDQRGHGQSGGRRGHIDHFQDLLSDLAAFIQRTQDAHPGVPIFLVGHSFGGQIALNFVVRYAKGLRGLIVSSPNIVLKMKIARWKRWISNYAERLVPTLLLRQEINAAWLTHDAAVVARYQSDPRIVRSFTVQTAMEILRNQDVVMALASRIHLPALFLHAGDDKVCCPEATRSFFRRVPVARKRLKIYDGFYHEIFNEIDCAQVFCDMEHWLNEQGLDERSHAGSGDTERAVETNASRRIVIERDERWMGGVP